MAEQGEVTRLLEDLSAGDQEAMDKLMPLVYEQLRTLARNQAQRERGGHTLQPTALVHEAFLRLADQKQVHWRNRAHFFAIAAQVIRRILVDYARGRGRAKRGGAYQKVQLDEALVASYERDLDLIALDEALKQLEQTSASQASIVQMRFFAGLTIKEAAEVLGVSETTVEREWRYARAWLFRRIGNNEGGHAQEQENGVGGDQPRG